MPYDTIDSLPGSTDKMPSRAKHIWRAAFNSAYDKYHDESRAFAIAFAAVKNAGYSQGKDGRWHKVKKALSDVTTHVMALDVVEKRDADHVVFGYSSIAIKRDGEPMIDLQGDLIDIEDLAEAVYAYVEESRQGGEMHAGEATSTLIESMVFTPEKLAKMGIPPGTVPCGWWTGYRVSDATFARIQEGSRLMFSIEGQAIREPIEE